MEIHAKASPTMTDSSPPKAAFFTKNPFGRKDYNEGELGIRPNVFKDCEYVDE